MIIGGATKWSAGWLDEVYYNKITIIDLMFLISHLHVCGTGVAIYVKT